MGEGSFGYNIASILTTLAMIAAFCLAVYMAGFLAGIVSRLISDVIYRGKGAGLGLQLLVVLCVGLVVGYFSAEFHATGNWPRLMIATFVGVVIGRMAQLNADIIQKIPPLPNRFPDGRHTRRDGHPP
jgi:ABC-type xylose transport system permease subunit